MLGDGPHIRTPLLTARQGYGGGIYDKRDKEQSSAVSTPPSVALSTLTPMMWVPPGFDRSVQHFTLEPTPSPAKNVNIALILSSILTGLVTVLDNTPYGLVLFPLVCRDAYSSVGVSMVLGAAAISQLTMTFTSKFPCAVGCMVVENLPFLTMMGREVTAILQARSEESKIVPTLIVLWALSTLLSGMAMGLLGATHAGRFTAYFPKHVLLGYVGGMGVFIFLSGIEITTNRTWTWTSAALSSQVEGQCGYRLMLTFLMSFLVPVVKMFSSGSPVALPCYFLSIPFVFWFCIYLFGFTADEARANEWVISVGANSGIPGLLPWTLVEPSLIAWDVLPTQMLTVAGLVLFTALHVPVNAPALGLTLGVSTDIDVEFRSHGIANMLTGAFGGLQSYMVYSTSALYHKCGGGGIIGGFIIAGITVFFAAGGNSVLSLLPRPLAGVVLIHLGFDLIYEVFIDSLSSITVMEYLQVVTVVVSMEVFGFMQGLGIGLLMACSAFIIAFASEDPIDVSSAGGGMRSKMMRPLKIRKKLDKLLERHAWILRVRGGSLFFGNSVRLLEHTETLLEIRTDLKFLVVHFTSLHGADCTAVSALAEIVTCCKRKNVIAVFAELPDDIIARVQHALESGQGNIYTCKCINDAFAWVEDKLLTSIKPPPPLVANRLFSILRPLVPDAGDDEISLLCKYFTRETHEAHTVLWKKGDDPSRALVVETGLLGVNCDEAFGLYSEFCKPGTICGELGLVTGESRQHDLVAIEDSVVWSFGKVGLKDPMVRSLFQQVALTMASHRLHHLTLLGHIHSV